VKTIRQLLRPICLITVLLSIILWCACGDTFRPVVIPIPPTPPDPRSAHTALAITNNGDFNPGSLMLIDVSGDSTAGVGNVGRHPSHATLVPPGAGHIAVANMVDNSVTLVSTLAGSSGLAAPTTITLSPHFNPVFLNSTENNVVYLANQGDAASAVPPTVPPSVAVINVASNTVTNTINLAPLNSATLNAVANPVSLTETPDARKVYVASQGLSPSQGSLTSINTVDKSANPLITDPSINLPLSVVARSDSARVYVLSQANGDVAAINTFTDALVSPAPVSAGAGADFMTYDAHLNRLYITNPALATLTILDATVDPPHSLATLTLPAWANPACTTGCSSVAALPDGTRAYVTTLQLSGTNVAATVTVINTTDNSIVGSFSLPAIPALMDCNGTRFRVSTAAAADSSRVYIGNCDAGNVAVIRTTDNTMVSLPAPVSAANTVAANIASASQSGSQTTYTYTLGSGTALQVGMSIVVTGMANTADNGSFTIASLGSGTFTVLNPPGVSASGQSGTGLATPLQNPVFVLTGP
jgi:hypothetical protein